MRIDAKSDGQCSACGAPFTAGTRVEWDRTFGARCVACAVARRYPPTPNRFGEECRRCGVFVAPGYGWLEADTSRTFGFVVRCQDAAGCGLRSDRRKRPAAP